MPTERAYNPPAPSIIPAIGQPKWKRTSKTEDVGPAPPPQQQQQKASIVGSYSGQHISSSSRRRSARPTRPSGKPTGPLIVEVDSSSLSSSRPPSPPLTTTTTTTTTTISNEPDHEHTATDNIAACSSSSTSTFPLCSTCSINEGRYTCPRCAAPYCSVDCYRIHDVPLTPAAAEAGAETGTDTGIVGGGRCTESFYRNRVESMTKLEIRDEDNAKVMRNILARSAANLSGTTTSSSADKGAGGDLLGSSSSGANHDTSASALTDEELVELAQAVLGMDDEGTDIDGSAQDDAVALLQSLPPHVREAFEASVRRGELSHLVASWRPWWESELGSAPAIMEETSNGACSNVMHTEIVPHTRQSDRDDDEEEGLEDILPPTPTFGPSSNSKIDSGPILDERILSIKRLHRGKSRTNALQYNVLDILFGVACSLRLYNGKPFLSTKKANISGGDEDGVDSDIDAAIGSAETMLSASSVLDNDVRFASVEEVLASCSEEALKLSKMNMCNASWAVLVSDITSILSSGRRGVLRALLDGKDIIRGGVKASKMAGSVSSTGRFAQARNDAQRRFKLAQKKIEFYLSWCLEYWEDIVGEEKLLDTVRRWVEQWESNKRDDSVLERTILNVSAHDSSPATNKIVTIAR